MRKSRCFSILKSALALIVIGFAGFWCAEARAFTHPGIPLIAADLDAVAANLAKEPWNSGYAALAADYRSQLSYTMQGPFAHVGRNESGTNPNLTQWRNDMIAIWNLSLMWYFTGNTAYAQKAHDILLQWANTQTSFGGIESGLDLGDYAFRFGDGADILRGTWPLWTQADTDKVKALFSTVYWPATSLPTDELGPTNKGSLSMAAAVAIAVFCDDQANWTKFPMGTTDEYQTTSPAPAIPCKSQTRMAGQQAKRFYRVTVIP
ncbi:MAG: alginate lyase family protein [Chthoniobacterales bacterium]